MVVLFVAMGLVGFVPTLLSVHVNQTHGFNTSLVTANEMWVEEEVSILKQWKGMIENNV